VKDDSKATAEATDTKRSAESSPDCNQTASVKIKPVSKRKPRDILCGRGVPILPHPGNIRLHQVVESYREAYLAASRGEKPALIRAVLEQFKNEGVRFMKLSDEGENVWEEVDGTYAYGKVGHALRCKKSRKAAIRGIKNLPRHHPGRIGRHCAQVQWPIDSEKVSSGEKNTTGAVPVLSSELSSSPTMVHANLFSSITVRYLLHHQGALELAQYRLWRHPWRFDSVLDPVCDSSF
jgi:hypothetical protein